MNIEEILLALESGEKLQDRENYRTEVRNYQNYLVLFQVNEDDTRQIFKLPGLYGLESIPIFLSEEDYLSFQTDYLEKHGYLDKIESNRDPLAVKRMTGKELFEILPKQSLDSFFVISPPDSGEFHFNFNLVEVFMDCFHETPSEFNLDLLSEITETKTAELDIQILSNSITAVRKSARGEIEEFQKFRKLFATSEWIILISQPTKNKLLRGEVSRDDFDLDRYGDRRIVVFSDAQAFDDFKNAVAAQSQVNLYNIKIDGKRIFGSDLSGYDTIIVNPNSPNGTKIGKAHFKKLNELFAVFEIERKLLHIYNSQQGLEHYSGHYYMDIKKFQNFILPLDKRLTGDMRLSPFKLPVHLVQDASGNHTFPIFTAKDCFEAFRLHSLENSDPDEINFIEPYFIDGLKLFQILNSMKTSEKIVFNSNGPIQSITFEPNFSLKVYCA